MKVVLVHGKFFNSWEAQGLGFIGSYLRRHLAGIDLSFYQGVFDSEDTIVQAGAVADWVLFSCTSPTYRWAEGLARRIKAVGKARTIIGGYHASAVPTTVGREFDHVVIGDGEQASLSLLTEQVTDRYVLGTPMRFEDLVWPDRELIRNERNIQVASKDTKRRITSFQAHRGCPFACKFCLDGACKVFVGPGEKVLLRNRSVEDLLDEIYEVVTRYHLDFFKFCDATWNADPIWVKHFCHAKLTRGIITPFFANIHAGRVDEEMFELMSAAGCREIGLGIESGSDRVLRHIGKGITKAMVREAVWAAKRKGIHVRGYFILGVPQETREDIQATEDFADELDLPEVGFAMLCPYPGTDYYRCAPWLWDKDWSGVDEYRNDFWHTQTLSNAELTVAQHRLTEKYRQRLTQHQRQVAVP